MNSLSWTSDVTEPPQDTARSRTLSPRVAVVTDCTALHSAMASTKTIARAVRLRSPTSLSPVQWISVEIQIHFWQYHPPSGTGGRCGGARAANRRFSPSLGLRRGRGNRQRGRRSGSSQVAPPATRSQSPGRVGGPETGLISRRTPLLLLCRPCLCGTTKSPEGPAAALNRPHGG